MGNNFFTICSFFYSLMLGVIYFRRKHIQSLETKLYSKLVITNFMNVVFAVLCFFTILVKESVPLINDFVSKSLLIIYLIWVLLFTMYLFVIVSKDEKILVNRVNKNRGIISIILIILGLFVYSLPLYYHNTNHIVYSYGPAANLTYVITGILMFVWVVVMLKNLNRLKNRKCIPIILFIILAIIAVLIQKMNPGLLLITAVETFITVIMYFTIENPDMKLLEEIHKSKEISDAANEEKTLFLYNVTQEIRNITDEINDNVDMILDSNSVEENKENAREIKVITSKFKTLTNELFDVSKMDSASIKVYNNKYNIKNILKEIVTVYSNICKNKDVDFRVNIDHDVPEILYGDSIGLKEVLSVIMDNSVKYTSKGFIEFNVNTIIKNDICRLVITIEDSGSGIKSDDITKMKIDDKSLAKANKLITLMNGAMMISSNYGIGTKVKIILDQKVEFNINEDVLKYENTIDNIKILMVDDSDSGIKIIDKIIKGSNIKMDFAMNGKECIDKIKAYDKYDVILLDEQLSQISAMELIKKIKNIRNFDIPIILLSKDNEYEYNDDFKKFGFSDYILKPVKKDDLLNKINVCIKKDK